MREGFSSILPIIVIGIIANLLVHLFLGIKVVRMICGSGMSG